MIWKSIKIRKNCKALSSKKITVRIKAVEALGKLRDPKAVKPLIKILNDEYLYVRGKNLEYIEKIKNHSDYIKYFNCISYCDKVKFLSIIIEALAKIRDLEVIESLIQILIGKYQFTNEAIFIKKIEKIFDCETKDFVIRALRIEDWDFRVKAGTALGKIGDSIAIKPLFQALQALKESYYVNHKKRLIEALAKIRDSRIVDPILYALNDKDSRVRIKAIEILRDIILRDIKDSRIVDPILNALKDKDGEVRVKALASLWNIRHSRIKEFTMQALRDEWTIVREYASRIILMEAKMGDSMFVESLIYALNDMEMSVRINAALALGKIGDSRAIEPLIQALKNSDFKVWKNVKEALINSNLASKINKNLVSERIDENTPCEMVFDSNLEPFFRTPDGTILDVPPGWKGTRKDYLETDRKCSCSDWATEAMWRRNRRNQGYSC